MRFRNSLSGKLSSAQQLGAVYDHIVFNRALLFWLHVILAIPIGFIYLSTLDTTHLHWWRRVGSYVLMRCTPALIPYLVSGVVTHRLAPAHRAPVWSFAFVLVVGTGAVGHFYLKRAPNDDILIAVIVQTVLYLAAARFLFGEEE